MVHGTGGTSLKAFLGCIDDAKVTMSGKENFRPEAQGRVQDEWQGFRRHEIARLGEPMLM